MKRIILTSWIALAGMLGAQDMPLSQVLIPGEDWRLASFRHEFTDAPTADAKGNFISRTCAANRDCTRSSRRARWYCISKR